MVKASRPSDSSPETFSKSKQNALIDATRVEEEIGSFAADGDASLTDYKRISDGCVVSFVAIDGSHTHHLGTGRKLLTDADNGLLGFDDDGRVVIDVGDHNAHHSLGAASRAAQVFDLHLQFVDGFGFAIQRHFGEYFT